MDSAAKPLQPGMSGLNCIALLERGQLPTRQPT
jgi:hypothetical protein